MRQILFTIAFIFSIVVAVDGRAADSVDAIEFVPGELLVKLAVPSESGEIKAIRARVGASRLRTLLNGDTELWKVPVGSEKALCWLLGRERSIRWAEPNYRCHIFSAVPDDPLFGNQWGHTRILSTAAWDTETGSDQIVIAVLDTGIDTGHPDLAAKIVAGFDFVDDDADPTDLHGHGTHVSGIAAGVTDNGVGIAGMSWGARVMPVRVLDEDGGGSFDDIIDGITWAVNHGADILNLSLGGTNYSQALQDAVNAAHAAGRLVIAAMGNYRNSNPANYPAACANVFAVAATERYDNYTSFSQYGAHCDIAAPGGEMSWYHDPDGIYSTLPTYACTMSASGYLNSYDYERGTSQAAPFVSGLAALVWSAAPGLSPDGVQGIIENTATDRGPAGWDQDYGWGLINAEAALQATDTIFSDDFETGDTGAWS